MNEIEKNLAIFLASNGRLPGDMNNDGAIGMCRGKGCIDKPSSTKFRGEYGGKTVALQAGPWVDLYLDELIEFKPEIGDNLASCIWGYENIKKNTPHLSSLKDMFANVFFTFLDFTTNNPRDNFYGTRNGIYLAFIFSPKDDADPSVSAVPATFMQKADLKVDDGNYQGGILRTCCYGTNSNCENTYQDSIDKKNTCSEFIYKVSDI